MKLSIVIPNYNGLALLKRNLSRVIEVVSKDKISYQIIVVDDASQDESAVWLETFIKEHGSSKIQLLINSQNSGFSSTVNRGAKEAQGDFILFLNTDVYPKPSFVTRALANFSDPEVFAVGCLDESQEESVVKRGRGIGWWERGFYVHRRGETDSNQTDWVSGGSGFFRREMFQKLAGFDTRYNPFYWEDIDLSYRAKKKGWKLVFESTSIVVHEHDKGAIKSKYKEANIKQISYRNQFLFVWKNANLQQIIKHILWLPYHFLNSIRHKDINFFSGFIHAVGRHFQYLAL